MKLKKDKVVKTAFFWGVLWIGLYFFIENNEWLLDCLAFCTQLKDSILEKLALRPWWLTAIITFQILMWIVIMFMGVRLWHAEKKERKERLLKILKKSA